MAVSLSEGWIRKAELPFFQQTGHPRGQDCLLLSWGHRWAGSVTPIVLWLPVGKAGCASPQIGVSSESSLGLTGVGAVTTETQLLRTGPCSLRTSDWGLQGRVEIFSRSGLIPQTRTQFLCQPKPNTYSQRGSISDGPAGDVG